MVEYLFNENDFKINDKVVHKRHGHGTVVRINNWGLVVKYEGKHSKALDHLFPIKDHPCLSQWDIKKLDV